MQIVTSVGAMQGIARRWKTAARKIGFVPTMGYLHAGHVSLITKARHWVGPGGKTVASIYVNPTQFGPAEDLARYPRDLSRDKSLCRQAGVDVLFVPPDQQMYPGRATGGYSTYVVEEALSLGMEGAARPTHFRGVTTIVAKLFNTVLPDVAVFGAKDFQQAAVVRRMARDLNFPVKIIVAPTVREPDGLALSSRNKYLSPAERAQATILWRSLRYAKQRILKSKKNINVEHLRREISGLIATCPAARLDYAQFFDAETLQPSAKERDSRSPSSLGKHG